jgi:hypothetical protein
MAVRAAWLPPPAMEDGSLVMPLLAQQCDYQLGGPALAPNATFEQLTQMRREKFGLIQALKSVL